MTDKTFNTDGTLYYPSTSPTPEFTSWVPEFFGNTMLVNGKVWPKVTLKPKKYRIVMLNGCQSRYLNIYFENNGVKLNFQIFRRDSDYLKTPVTVKEHLLLIGARIEIFLDLTGISGTVLMKNNAATPYPMGTAPDEYTSQILKIVMYTSKAPYTAGPTFIQQIIDRLNSYISTKTFADKTTLDFLDQPQSPNYNGLTTTPTYLAGKTITSYDFANSTDTSNDQSLSLISSSTSGTASTTSFTTLSATSSTTVTSTSSQLLN